MGYDNTEVFFGRHHDGQDVIAGFRFIVPLAQGAVLTNATLSVYLEEKLGEGITALDYFTDDDETLLTAHTMDVGPAEGWLSLFGWLKIRDNQVNSETGAYQPVPNSVHFVDCAAADGIVRADVRAYAYVNTAQGGIVFRIVDSDNYWVFYESSVSGSEAYYLRKKVAGVWTTVASGGGSQGFHEFEVTLNGSSIIAKRASVEIYNGTDSDLMAATRYGVYLYTSGDRPDYDWAKIDNFEFVPVVGTSGSLAFTVQCDDVNNSQDFQTGGLPGTRTLTSGSTDLGDISGWAKDMWGTTIDIKEPIQEVLDRPGWISGNYLSIIVSPLDTCADGERFRVESYDGYPSQAAKLALSWS